MDEEEQKDGFLKKAGDALKKGEEAIKKKPKKQVFKIIINVIASVLLKFLMPVLIASLLLTAIANFLKDITGANSKQANAFAVKYFGNSSSSSSAEESQLNSIIVDINNITENGAYKLIYEFKDENGNIYNEEEAINNIRRDLLESNKELDLSKFSNSELKIIGALMYNGLIVEQYNEEELKALVIFVKADIASKSFDLRKGDSTNIDLETLRDSDEVYGTLKLHKTSIETDEDGNIIDDKEIKLDFVPYGDEASEGTFCYMVAQKDRSVLNNFSINEEGNLVIARWGESTTTYKYLDESGKKTLSAEDKQKITPENLLEDTNELNISLYPLQINYEQYIARYITNYDFLSDLLITTENVDFCENIAQLAFNSEIVFNLKEELIIYNSYSKRVCKQTNLLYDYVKYEVSGKKEVGTGTWENIKNGTGEPSNDSSLTRMYGWNTNMKPVSVTGNSGGGTSIYEWNYNKIDYRLTHTSTISYSNWTLYKKNIDKTETLLEQTKNKEEGDLINLNNNHVKEEYSTYTIDEDYTRKEDFKYIIEETSEIKSNRYDLDLLKIDCWFLKYERQYNEPTLETQPPEGNTAQRKGQYPEEYKILLENITEEAQIRNDKDVQDFITKKEQQYNKYEGVECKVNNLTVKQKTKTDEDVEYSSTMKMYSFNEEEADTTQIRFKNIEYINGQPSYTLNDENGNEEIGFLSIYKTYRDNGIDLYLENDSEKQLFKLLESDTKTIGISDIMKYLLYVYDGIDRGVTNLEYTFTVIDINLIKGGGVSAFGTNLTKEEFIEKAQKYCGTNSLFSDLADDFYDICTLPKYNVNPCLVFAWAGLESDFGKSAPQNNLFGMGIYNGENSGVQYDSYNDSIEDFCKWIIKASTPGTDDYEFAYQRGQEFSNVNEVFQGEPQNNIYVLFSTYAHLGNTHLVDEKNSYKNEDERYLYYQQNGSDWGDGGRIQIYYMYEHFLYQGEYAVRCTHKYGTDPTTLQEKADYSQYTVEKRIELAKDIFGKDIFLGKEGHFQELNDGERVGIYTSRSGRVYTEWWQNTSTDIGDEDLYTTGKIMGNHGCNVYGYANLLSSTITNLDIWEVYNTYMSRGHQDDEWTMEKVLKNNNIDADVVRIGNNYDLFVSVLHEGRGVLTWVGSAFNCLYTTNMHWVVIADIRESQLGSYMGYDVYVLTSNKGAGHGWQKIETIATNLRGPELYGYGFYIND